VNFVNSTLAELENFGLKRTLKIHSGGLVNFSTNDYLDLSTHPLVVKRAVEAVETFGAGSGGSRLMAGNLPLHEELEHRLAQLTGMETSLVYGSGFLANTGVLTALAGRNDTIFSDRLNHASIVDGAITSRGRVHRYRHCDVQHLSDLLKKHTEAGKKIIVTESVFSMDGDIAPVREIYELSRRNGCILVVDEAHAVGVFGHGGGICRKYGVLPDFVTGTLSKALGSYGGFAACSRETRDFLVNRSRSFVFSTGLPPASTGAAVGALQVIESRQEAGAALVESAKFFRESLKQAGFNTGNSASQIVPVIVGESSATVSFSHSLQNRGILVVAIRPPTVPEGSARLRFSITLRHQIKTLQNTIEQMKNLTWN
jgi:glycine C-acetyltransferase/8-amino-7-oxononanoate synthase